MWNKAILFDSNDIAEQILQTSDPKKQKALGRKVRNFDEKKWDERKLDIVIKGNILKFTQNEKLKNELLSHSKILVEASPYDKIWGVGLHFDDDAILDEKKWQGENLLGIALMEVRNNLKKRV